MMRVLTLAAAATGCVLLQTPLSFAEDGIHCSEIGGAYNELLAGNRKRSQDTVAQLKALSPKQQEQKNALVKKECSIGGEMIGLMNVWQAQIDACAANGEKLGTLPADVKGTLNELKENMTGLCG